jgi:hypothetical protein
MRRILIASRDPCDCPTGKSVRLPISRPAPFRKIFRFALHPNQIHINGCPAPTRGVLRSVRAVLFATEASSKLLGLGIVMRSRGDRWEHNTLSRRRLERLPIIQGRQASVRTKRALFAAVSET